MLQQSLMLTYNNFVELFNNIASAHHQINDFGIGDISNIESTTDNKYCRMWVTPVDTTVFENVEQRSFNILVFDLVNTSENNLNDVISDTEQILKDIIKILKVESVYYTCTNEPTLELFTERFGDDVTGWATTVIIESALNNGYCDVPADLFISPYIPLDGGGSSRGGGSFQCSDIINCSTIIDIQNNFFNYLPLIGGTMSGVVNYTSDLSSIFGTYSLVDKNYVDNAIPKQGLVQIYDPYATFFTDLATARAYILSFDPYSALVITDESFSERVYSFTVPKNTLFAASGFDSFLGEFFNFPMPIDVSITDNFGLIDTYYGTNFYQNAMDNTFKNVLFRDEFTFNYSSGINTFGNLSCHFAFGQNSTGVFHFNGTLTVGGLSGSISDFFLGSTATIYARKELYGDIYLAQAEANGCNVFYDGIDKENVSNKVTTLTGANNTTYPTTLAVSNAIASSTPSLSGTTPIIYTAGVISIQQSNTSSNGYISSTDWNIFNNKQNIISLTTTGASGAATFITNTLNIPTYTLAGLGGISASSTDTLSNKRFVPRVVTITSSATITPNWDITDLYTVSALATNTTIAAPTGTPSGGEVLALRIKDNGTARTLTFNSVYRFSIYLTAPTTTEISKTLYMFFMFNAIDNKYDCMSWINGF